MPSIKIETSAVLAAAAEKNLALEVSSACAAWLNKPENVVQIRIESGMTITFGGNAGNDSAFIVIALIGAIDPAVQSGLPARFAALLAPYGINAEKIFLRYMESDSSVWGWN